MSKLRTTKNHTQKKKKKIKNLILLAPVLDVVFVGEADGAEPVAGHRLHDLLHDASQLFLRERRRETIVTKNPMAPGNVDFDFFFVFCFIFTL